jgi:phosphatidylserine decarboxylase
MATVWAGDITPAPRRAVTTLPPRDVTLQKGEELGRFNMGSTVILLFRAGRVSWHEEVRAGATVQLGQALGTLK